MNNNTFRITIFINKWNISNSVQELQLSKRSYISAMNFKLAKVTKETVSRGLSIWSRSLRTKGMNGTVRGGQRFRQAIRRPSQYEFSNQRLLRKQEPGYCRCYQSKLHEKIPYTFCIYIIHNFYKRIIVVHTAVLVMMVLAEWIEYFILWKNVVYHWGHYDNRDTTTIAIIVQIKLIYFSIDSQTVMISSTWSW